MTDIDLDNPPWTEGELRQARVGRAVRHARLVLMLDKPTFARALGVSMTELRELESGRRRANDALRGRIASLRKEADDLTVSAYYGAAPDLGPDEEFLRPTREGLERGTRGRVLRLARQALAMDNEAFAAVLGIPLADALDFERGRRLTDDATLARARELRASVPDDLAFERSGVSRRY